MKRSFYIGLFLAALMLSGARAYAQAYKTLKDGSGASFNSLGKVDSLSNFAFSSVICDFTDPDNCAQVDSNGLHVVIGTTLPAFAAPPSFILQSSPTQGAASPGGAATYSSLMGMIYNATPPSLSTGQQVALQADHAGNAMVDVAAITGLTAGSTTIGQTGSLIQCAVTSAIPAYTTGTTNNVSCTPSGGVRIANAPATSGGLSLDSVQVANNTTSLAVKASAGQVYGIEAFNNSATIAYVKLYNAAQGSTTCGSGTPIYRGMIPAATSGGSGYVSINTFGLPFSTAITLCVTTGFADTDTTAPAASSYLVNVFYE